MPKRPLDVSGPGAMSSERAMKKTERSHEENQERAYIAASRRADRSIEARVQSARMASEIHKKRTGKGFKISEEIVMKEEMYEEEDDDLPRHYRALAAHLQTSSPDMNSRLSAYLTGQVAMASMARQKEVDKLFAESFPNAARMGQQMQQSAYFQGLGQQHTTTSSPQQSPPFHTPNFNNGNQHPQQLQAMHRRPSALSTTHSHSSNATSYMHSPTSTTTQKRPSVVDSPPMLSPESHTDASTPSATSTPHFTPAQQYHTYISPHSLSNNSSYHHPDSQTQPFQSSFTSELSQDTKLLANIDMSDPLAGAFYGMPDHHSSSTFDYTGQFNPTALATGIPDDSTISKQLAAYPQTDYFHHHAAMQPQGRYLVSSDDLTGSQGASRIGTPGGTGEGDSWDNWIDENQWAQGLAAAAAAAADDLPTQRWMKNEQQR